MVYSRPVASVVACFLLALFSGIDANAEALIPLDFYGSLTYTYAYSETGEIQAETSTLTASGSGAGYIWQPWFININAGLNVGLSQNTTNTDASETATTAKSGNISFRVFPQSRFPFYFAYTRTDSLIENTDTTNPLETRYQSENILLTQSYYARSGAFSLFTWNHHVFDSGDEEFDVDSLNASYRTRYKYHRISAAAAYIETGRQVLDARPNTLNLSADHAYLPGNELSVTSLFSHNVNDNDSDISPLESTVTQASSNFSWRPDHKAYSVRGGVLLSHAETSLGDDATDRFSTTGGLTYQFSNRLVSTVTVSAGVSEYAGQQSTQQGASANIAYSSQQYFVAGFNYSFSLGGGLSMSRVDVSGESTEIELASEDQSEESANVNFGHTASQSWATGPASSVSLGLSQGGSMSKSSSADELSRALSHGVNLGWNHRGANGSTFANANFNDSRSYGDTETTFQIFNAQLSRNQTLSRVSNFVASMTYQLSDQSNAESEEGDSTSQSTLAQATYRNSKIFGVFRLRLESKLEYSELSNDSVIGAGGGTTKFSVKFAYNIGKLSTSLGFRVTKNTAGEESYGMNFGATRTF